jgi:hypothetical protein
MCQLPATLAVPYAAPPPTADAARANTNQQLAATLAEQYAAPLPTADASRANTNLQLVATLAVPYAAPLPTAAAARAANTNQQMATLLVSTTNFFWCIYFLHHFFLTSFRIKLVTTACYTEINISHYK